MDDSASCHVIWSLRRFSLSALPAREGKNLASRFRLKGCHQGLPLESDEWWDFPLALPLLLALGDQFN